MSAVAMLITTSCLQVLWLGKPEIKCSWEPENNVALNVISEFENSIAVGPSLHHTIFNRQKVSIVAAEKCESGMYQLRYLSIHCGASNCCFAFAATTHKPELPPPSKHAKCERWISQDTNG